MFADDTTLNVIGHSTTDISAKLSCVLAFSHKWFLESGLQLNVTKGECMLIHSCRWRSLPPLEIQLRGTIIQQVQSYKYLGVVISDTLSWSHHIDLVRGRVAKGIGLLHRLSWFLPRQALSTMYNAYILPHSTYADAVWGTCTQAQSRGLEHLQNYAACIILHRRVSASATNMRRKLHWPMHTGFQMGREWSYGCVPKCLWSQPCLPVYTYLWWMQFCAMGLDMRQGSNVQPRTGIEQLIKNRKSA